MASPPVVITTMKTAPDTEHVHKRRFTVRGTMSLQLVPVVHIYCEDKIAGCSKLCNFLYPDKETGTYICRKFSKAKDIEEALKSCIKVFGELQEWQTYYE